MTRDETPYPFGDVRHPRITYWAATIGALGIVVGPAFATGGINGPVIVEPGLPSILAVLAAAVAVVVRGRYPRSALAATLALFVMGALIGVAFASHFAAVMITLFGLARRTDRRTTLIAGTVAAAVIVTSAALIFTGRWQSFEAMAQLIAFIGFAAASGDATRSRREYIDAITERARRAEETKESEAKRRVAEERVKIARDLHDVLAHHIAVINLQASVASGAVKDRPEEVEKSLVTIRQAARTVLGEIGGLLTVLRGDEAGDEAGNGAGNGRSGGAPGIGTARPAVAPVPGLGQLANLLTDFRRSGLEVDLRTWGAPRAVPDSVDVVAYRIIQEALTNAHKHGADRSALLNIDYRGSDRDGRPGVEVIVTNTTSDSHPAPPVSGHGLSGVRERVAAVGGRFATARGPGPVYRFTAWLPIAELSGAELSGADEVTEASPVAGSATSGSCESTEAESTGPIAATESTEATDRSRRP